MDKNKQTDCASASTCAVEFTVKVIGGRWKLLILRELFGGTRRFGELGRGIKGISQRMLTQQLRELERDGILARKVYAQVPPKVEYSMTDRGLSLAPILEMMHQWGAAHQVVMAEEQQEAKSQVS